jgi:hypothetical protein
MHERPHDEHRTARVPYDRFGDRAEEHALQALAPVRADDDDGGEQVARHLHDHVGGVAAGLMGDHLDGVWHAVCAGQARGDPRLEQSARALELYVSGNRCLDVQEVDLFGLRPARCFKRLLHHE